MRLINRVPKRDKNTRENAIATASAIGIAVNTLIAVTKVMIGTLTSSIAILSEGVNNASDVLSSALTLVGTKLAGKHPDKKHPFGYGRIEYLTSLVISAFILVSGMEMLFHSVRLIFRPERLNVSGLSVILIAASAAVKLALSIYTIKIGRKTESSALEAVGVECRNDVFVSLVTIVSTAAFVLFRLSIDAYVGVFTSAIIIKSGADILRETVSELLGRAGAHELADKIYREIHTTDGILAAADMKLHNYGPNVWSGSVNVEADHEKTVGEMHQVIHALRYRIMRKYHVAMVFEIYAANSDHEEVKRLRKTIGSFVRARDDVKSFHAVYLDPVTDRIYCDFIVDYALKDRDTLRERFADYLRTRYPESELVLTIETEFV